MSATATPLGTPLTAAREPVRTAAILVATDGSERSDAALATAHRLAPHVGAVEVISVVEPMPIISPEAQLPIAAELEEQRRADRVADVRAQMKRVTGSETTWPAELGEGSPAVLIVRRARDLHAKLIVVGLGRHRIVDRLFGSEMALQVLRLATVPVLCVAPAGLAVPARRVLAAVDFSAMSTDAVRAALSLVAGDAHLTLAHVLSRDQATGVWEQWEEIYGKALAESFAKLERDLALPAGIGAEVQSFTGDPAGELLHAADAAGADLIVTGTHGHGFLSRMLLGSVATGLVRGAKCSVLVVPRAEYELGEHGGTAGAEHPLPPKRIALRDWAPRLEEFTKRNTGRRANLEVDDPELGAQAQEIDYPLLGVSYDHRDARVEIMLGELGYGGRHFTRSIGDVTSIDVLQDDQDRDLALRVQHGAGQTLLTLTR